MAEASPPEGLLDAFWAYERALMSDDVAELDRLFADGPTTLRGDAAGLLVGHERIREFRAGRGGAPQRRIVQTHVQVVDDDHALVVAVTELSRGGRGQQTQLWARGDRGWAVTAAHVSVPAPAMDSRIWRVLGDPLVLSTGSGPLDGETVAVKDLFGVEGHAVGAGNPSWLAQQRPQREHAPVVAALLAAGAAVRGITRTDEFAYSLAGANAHSGTPPNPRAPYRLPGGSSSGSASAVALGHASIGLGTDTGGSIRVPASYQGLFGIRTSYGAVDKRGLLPLAPSFDTVGWLTRDPLTLASVGGALLHPWRTAGLSDLFVDPTLVARAEPDVAAAVAAWAADRAVVEEKHADLDDLPAWVDAFRTLQAWEAWRCHGAWVARHWDHLGDDVGRRFQAAAWVRPDEARLAAAASARARNRIRAVVGDRILVLPSSASTAPVSAEAGESARHATLALTCVAGLGGLPAVSIPTTSADGLPCGVCLVAAPGRDRDLLALARTLSP